MYFPWTPVEAGDVDKIYVSSSYRTYLISGFRQRAKISPCFHGYTVKDFGPRRMGIYAADKIFKHHTHPRH
jgi:hypothetical protein